MKFKNFIVALTEDMKVKPLEGSADITQNSYASQFIGVKLDGWLLEEGHRLCIGFKKRIEGIDFVVNPVFMYYDPKQDIYLTPAPPEVISENGEWEFAISNRWDFEEDENGKDIYKSLNTGTYTMVVKNTIVDSSGKHVSDMDLMNAVRQIEIYLKGAAILPMPSTENAGKVVGITKNGYVAVIPPKNHVTTDTEQDIEAVKHFVDYIDVEVETGELDEEDNPITTTERVQRSVDIGNGAVTVSELDYTSDYSANGTSIIGREGETAYRNGCITRNRNHIEIPNKSGTMALLDDLQGVASDLHAGSNIEIKENVISVLTTNDAQEDNTRPITSAGVQVIVGNIDVLLKTI